MKRFAAVKLTHANSIINFPITKHILLFLRQTRVVEFQNLQVIEALLLIIQIYRLKFSYLFPMRIARPDSSAVQPFMNLLILLQMPSLSTTC